MRLRHQWAVQFQAKSQRGWLQPDLSGKNIYGKLIILVQCLLSVSLNKIQDARGWEYFLLFMDISQAMRTVPANSSHLLNKLISFKLLFVVWTNLAKHIHLFITQIMGIYSTPGIISRSWEYNSEENSWYPCPHGGFGGKLVNCITMDTEKICKDIPSPFSGLPLKGPS